MSLETCTPNLKFLPLSAVEISLTKNLERKKKEPTQGRTNRRMPICNLTLQLVFVNLYTKSEVSIFNGYGDIFDKKGLQNYGMTEERTNERTDGRREPQTDVNQYTPPLFQSGGIIITKYSLLSRALD